MCVGGGGGGGGRVYECVWRRGGVGEAEWVELKPVLLACNLTINYDAAPNYKHKFGPHRDRLAHQ